MSLFKSWIKHLSRLKEKSIIKHISFLLHQSNLFLILVLIFLSGCQQKWEIDNPYKDVDWENHKQYIANLHAHTSRSDGSMSPQAVVDLYHQNGYSILAITDHNRVTYPWEKFTEFEPSELSRIRNEYGMSGIIPENSSHRSRGITPEALVYENRDPAKLSMVAIQGNEISLNANFASKGRHDMGSYYSDVASLDLTGDEILTEITEKKGFAMFVHPERYDFSLQWYLEYYNQFESLIGLELLNGGRRESLQIWDSLLTELMPQRPVWGFSNDDTHTINHYGRSWNVFILSELSEENVRHGMEHGLCYFVNSPDKESKSDVPVINSVKVNSRHGEIHVYATGQDSIVWISGGRKVFTGDKIELGDLPEIKGYVRAELYSNNGMTIVGTQPFGITKP